MRDIGGIIWVVLVIFGVISTIRSSVRKAASERERAAEPPQVQAVMPLVQPPAPPLGPLPPPVARRTVVPPRRPGPPPVQPSVAAPSLESELLPAPRPSGVLGGMFEDRKMILRAIVAAEVLGKPKALQEQSIWSPRHSEPSI